jgi:hypothetical protein
MYELLFDEVGKAGLPDLVGELILAAFEGDGPLARLLGGTVAARDTPPRRS